MAKLENKIICPGCSTEHDAATSSENPDATPKKGDIIICINCGSINEFTTNEGDLDFLTVDKRTKMKIEDPQNYALMMKMSNLIRNEKNSF